MFEIFIACCVVIGAIVTELKVKTYNPQSEVETHAVSDDDFRAAVEWEMENKEIGEVENN